MIIVFAILLTWALLRLAFFIREAFVASNRMIQRSKARRGGYRFGYR